MVKVITAVDKKKKTTLNIHNSSLEGATKLKFAVSNYKCGSKFSWVFLTSLSTRELPVLKSLMLKQAA